MSRRQSPLGLTGYALLLALGSLAVVPLARAHPLAPAALILNEIEGAPPGTLRMTWRTSRLRPRGEELVPALPEHCHTTPNSEREELQADVLVVTSEVSCGSGPVAGLDGAELRIHGLERTETNVYVELLLADGRRLTSLLHARAPAMRFMDQAASSADSVPGFVRLGIGHLLSGVDHVLFVLGLVLLVAGLRQLFWLVSAFTVGHSVSLALSATGVVRLPSAAVEMTIALSLLWLALRVLQRREHLAEPPPSPRRAAAVCAAFGLLHGLGFASAFAETGVSGDALPRALLGFNVGVELGQLAIVLPVALGLGLLRRRDSQQRTESRVMLVGAYVIGSASAYYVLERSPSVLAELLALLG